MWNYTYLLPEWPDEAEITRDCATKYTQDKRMEIPKSAKNYGSSNVDIGIRGSS